ncbi:protein adenylyltransferase Fic isoform X3 [Neodiprion pinetum]|uniref:protein adenylyltransferase Fic isoform X3 n=1 Tax=Neodiprion pinetum TaxID=441929 RepID=UPI0037215341
MSPPCLSQCCQTPSASINEEIKKYPVKNMELNRVSLFLIFISGMSFAVIGTLLSNYFQQFSLSYVGDDNRRIFAPLPSENFLNLHDEGTLSLSLRNSEISKIKPVTDAASVSEAISSLHLALEMKLSGKQSKAVKLFQHAVALAPKHPDVLNHYGEFLEHTQKDVIKADEFYVRALTYQPNHEGALANRQRTARVVDELDQRMLRRIDEKRDALSAIPDSNAALRRAKKEAYFQHIYHTVGIEGNTMNLAQTRAIVETRTAVAGKSIDEHNEILGLDAAMKYINATLVNRTTFITTLAEIHFSQLIVKRKSHHGTSHLIIESKIRNDTCNTDCVLQGWLHFHQRYTRNSQTCAGARRSCRKWAIQADTSVRWRACTTRSRRHTYVDGTIFFVVEQ